MKKGFGLFTVVVAILMTLGLGVTFGQEKTTLRVISHRMPVTEIYVNEMGKAVPNVQVEARFIPYTQAIETARLALSGGGASPYEIVYGTAEVLHEFASKGWLVPLNQYIEKYRKEYKFDDIPKNVWDAVSYQGRIYGIPTDTNPLIFFYRKDLFDKYNLKPPKTYDQYLEVARIIQEKESIYGTTLTFKSPDGASFSFHGYLQGYGGRWFDERNKPAFNGPEGVKALTMMKKLMKYAPSGVLTFHNDQSMVALQQGQVAMGIQWYTRAAAMDNEKVSKVVGKIEFAVPPSGEEGRPPSENLSISAYAIPKNLSPKVNEELVFKVIAGGTDEESMIEAAPFALVARESVFKSPAVEKKRWWPASLETRKTALGYPKLPKMMAVLEIVGHHVGRALSGEAEVQEALDKAAAEVKEMLEKN